MNTTLVALSILVFSFVLLGFFGFLALRKWGFPTAKVALESYWSARWSEINERLLALETDVGSLPRVWEEFATDAKKSQERARWHVRRVKKELEDRGLSDPEIDTLDSQIRRRDGDRGGQGELPDLFSPVEKIPTAPEDPEIIALRRKWANG